MGDVVRWPRHRLHRCDRLTCAVCSGGLVLCVTCCGAERTMPTDCPGHVLDADTLDEIGRGEIDYRRAEGGWVCTYTSPEKRGSH
jgi:hypothetical protein